MKEVTVNAFQLAVLLDWLGFLDQKRALSPDLKLAYKSLDLAFSRQIASRRGK